MNFLALGICLGSFTGVLCAEDAPDVKPAPPSQATAPDPKSEEALEILKKANEKMMSFKTFQADIRNSDETSKIKSKTVFYQRNNPDGVTETRHEFQYSVGNTPYSRISITNREGSWELTPITAIKMEFKEEINKKAQQEFASTKKRVSPSKYSLSEAMINGKSYWVVKEIISNDVRQKVQELLLNKNGIHTSIPSGSIPLPVLTLYRIGKEDGFIYSIQQYDDKGNVMSDLTYENVQINLPLGDDLFVIPKNLKIKVAKTTKDYVAIKTGEIR